MKSMSMMKVLACAAALAAAVFALAACGGDSSKSPTATAGSGGKSPTANATAGAGTDEAAVRAALDNELKAYQAGDWPAAYQIATPRFRTTCSLEQFVKAVSGTDFSTLVMDQIKVRIEGDKAYVTNRQMLDGKDVSAATDAAPEIFLKIDGKWYDDSKGASGCS